MSEEREEVQEDWRADVDPSVLEASRNARARLRREGVARAKLWRTTRAGSASTTESVNAKPVVAASGEGAAKKPVAQWASEDFEVCHATVVLRYKKALSNPAESPYHRVAVQVGCGTHLGDSRLDYINIRTAAARDLPQRTQSFGRDVARIVAAELSTRCPR